VPGRALTLLRVRGQYTACGHTNKSIRACRGLCEMKILAIEPYYGGSHKAFLDGWSARSRHAWTVLGLPPYKWKWRMRHAGITMSDVVRDRVEAGESWDVLFCSDMLNLAEFLGLAPEEVRRIPSIAYFHENQLTYPVRHESERDYHFTLTNLSTALAATRVWFNSAYHRDSFLAELPRFLSRMPDHQPFEVIPRLRERSDVQPQGIGEFPHRGARLSGPLRILWAARWEHDKNPDEFFEALRLLRGRDVEFRVSVIGEQFRESPTVFDAVREDLREHIDRWGYQETRDDYQAALAEADVIVSTAQHEFFGISVVEAIAAGAYPLLPRRLSYPEILGEDEALRSDGFFYDGGAADLADRLAELADRIKADDLWQGDPKRALRKVARFAWKSHAPRLDAALGELVT
jgi:glycosyltransferase involved in cell wall biosynthesis